MERASFLICGEAVWGKKSDFLQEENVRFGGGGWRVLCAAPKSGILFRIKETKQKRRVLMSLLGLRRSLGPTKQAVFQATQFVSSPNTARWALFCISCSRPLLGSERNQPESSFVQLWGAPRGTTPARKRGAGPSAGPSRGRGETPTIVLKNQARNTFLTYGQE